MMDETSFSLISLLSKCSFTYSNKYYIQSETISLPRDYFTEQLQSEKKNNHKQLQSEKKNNNKNKISPMYDLMGIAQNLINNHQREANKLFTIAIRASNLNEIIRIHEITYTINE